MGSLWRWLPAEGRGNYKVKPWAEGRITVSPKEASIRGILLNL